MTDDPAGRILCAIDTTDIDAATRIARVVRGHVGGIKLGKAFFTAHGPQGVRRLADGGQPVFLDLKYHDIPNTVAGAVRAAMPLGCAMLTVHASGGTAMVRAAAEARGGATAPLILAVTVLTSLGEDDLMAVGQMRPMADQVLRLARLARTAGADGIVASPQEVAGLRRALGPDAVLVVPGVRPGWAGADDQKRVMTPAEAVAAGADYLVIGRPITRSPDPADAARRIAGEIAGRIAAR